MPLIRVSVVVGNPKPKSRTLQIATRAAEVLLEPRAFELDVIDLAEHISQIFEWPSPQMSALTDAVAASDLLIAASPTYKGSYTGLLKAFFDRYPSLGLRGVVAVPVMTGADLRHAIAPEVSLRPLLVELGAIVPTQSLYFVMNQMGEFGEVLEGWAQEARERAFMHLPAMLDGLNVPQEWGNSTNARS